MARFFIALISSLLLTALTTACSSTPIHWQKESWAKLSPEDAHTLCTRRAKMSTGTGAITADDAVAPNWSEYMKECMAGRGYTLVRGQEEPSRGTASVVAPTPNG